VSTRRRLRAARGALVILATILAAACTAPAPEQFEAPVAADGIRRDIPAAQRMNLILILTDDQWASSVAQMPNVTRLLRGHGITFRNAFVTTSLCCPSRASILTGQYAHNTGVHTNQGPNGGAHVFKDASTVATWLHDAGYTTSLIGKYLNGYSTTTVPPGWDDWHAIAGRIRTGDDEDLSGAPFYDFRLNENGRMVTYGSTPSDYSTDVYSRKALEFIDRAAAPFFLYVSTNAPHLPSTPATTDIGKFANEPPYRPPSFNEPDVGDKPWGARVDPLTTKEIRDIDSHRRSSLESLLAVDRMVASIVGTLERKGELDRTVIMFTSDNGFLYGEHRLSNKIWAYEPSIGVPMIVRVPWLTKPVEDSRMVLNIDIAHTFADIAGVKPSLKQDGLSLVPLLTRAKTSWRDEVLIEWLGGGTPPLMRFGAVRTDRYKLIVYRDLTRELYDLKSDPYELRNLSGLPGMRSIEDGLATRLRRLIAR
jgi:arylsulfatase A-like enzyme